MRPTEHEGDRILAVHCALSRLEGDDELLRIALVDFLQSLPQSISDLIAAQQASDIDSMLAAANSLSDSAGNVGAESTSRLAMEVERIAARDSLAGCGDLIQAIAAQSFMVREAILDYLSHGEAL